MLQILFQTLLHFSFFCADTLRELNEDSIYSILFSLQKPVVNLCPLQKFTTMQKFTTARIVYIYLVTLTYPLIQSYYVGLPKRQMREKTRF
ncbi:hypothetical protein EVA_20447 [gut metagenome]|uniref:Uncharacterized protein n=1 Tax=gut metagenome TaxID=749906 RepID=J9FPD2_9ZZZZ